MEPISFFVSTKTLFTVFHVLSVVFGMGAALASDVLFSFYSADKKLSKSERMTLTFLSQVVWLNLIAISLSGVALFLSNPAGYLASVKFLGKMSILGVLLVNGYFLHRLVLPHMAKKGFLTDPENRHLRRRAFAGGAVSVISWLIVCTLGVLDSVPISYGVLMGIYGVILIGGIVVALGIERKELN